MKRQLRVARERVTLNPEQEKHDTEQCEVALKNDVVRDELEQGWYAALGSGLGLKHEKCDLNHYKAFLQQSKFATNDRQLSEAYGFYDAQVLGEDSLDFIGFVKCLFHLGMMRQKHDDHQRGLAWMLKTHVMPFVAAVRKANDLDGTGPDNLYLDHVEVDQLLYVFDTVFDRLFHRYRDLDRHDNRDLSLEQNQILDQYVELDEMRAILKDYGFFPKRVSFVEISATAQFACFGRIVRSVSQQSAGFQSNIQEVKMDQFRAQIYSKEVDGERPLSPSANASLADRPPSPRSRRGTRRSTAQSPTEKKLRSASRASFGSVSPKRDSPRRSLTSSIATADEAEAVLEDKSVVNPLFVEALPPEFQRDEPLLDKPRFMCWMVRLAQCLYNSPEMVKRLPTISSRVEEMLGTMGTLYERMFGRSVEQDCDYSEAGIPTLLSATPTSAVSPQDVPMGGKTEIHISGNNFGEKRGVFVRFQQPPRPSGTVPAVMMRCKDVAKRRVTVHTPPAEPTDVSVDVVFQHTEYTVTVHRTTAVTIECSNDRMTYSTTDPPQIVRYVKTLPVHTINTKVTNKLLKTFSGACAIGQAYNSKFLTKQNWRMVKDAYSITELNLPVLPDGAPQFFPADAKEQDKECHFLLNAEQHEGVTGPAVDFKMYLKTLALCFFHECGEPRWAQRFAEVADLEVKLSAPKKVAQYHSVLDEEALARKALAAVEKRSVRELDVYLGPVLCGSIHDAPGRVTSKAEGKHVTHRQRHPAVTYSHFDDVISERLILQHIDASHSFHHAVSRLLRQGFEVACRHPSPSTRKPAGRCWSIISPQTSEIVGALWDYEGQFSPVAWQPVDPVLRHRSVTLCIFTSEEERDVVQGYLAFTKGQSLAGVRQQLITRGYILSTRLYRSL